jgi:hypothetical protein
MVLSITTEKRTRKNTKEELSSNYKKSRTYRRLSNPVFFTRTRPGFISLLLACIAMMHALTFFLSFFSRAIFLKENQMWPRAHAFLLYSRKTSILTQFLLVFLNIF